MTLAQAITQSSADVRHLVLAGVSWRDYVKLIDDLEAAGRRFRSTYDSGDLEIMTRGLGHESRKVTFSRAFELWAEFVGVRFEAFGSETARLQPEGKGLEPDECYFLGPRRPRRASGNALDLRTQPAPDLAIEIDVTSSSVPREPIYAAFKVREIWLWDGTKIVVRQLYRGRYRTIERSALLPDAPIHVFQLVMDRAIAAEDQQAGRDVLRAWLREHGR